MGLSDRLIGILLHYETFKILDIRNKKIGFVFRALQVVILLFAIFSIVYKKGYQATDVGISTVMMKVKGVGYVDFKDFSSLYKGIHVYDSADYIIPPNQETSFFVVTNMIITPNQTQEKCPEDPQFKDNWCETDDDCKPAFEMVKLGNGIRTGACVQSDRNSSIRVCEIHAWCPPENESLPKNGYNLSNVAELPYLHAAQNFTVLVKNQIRFPKFNVVRRNIISSNNNSYLRNCAYNQTHKDNGCPIFTLGDIIDYCGDKFEDVAFKGATYGIVINWDCDLDKVLDTCTPTYDFEKLEDPDAAIAKGYNFRYAEYYEKDGIRRRTLIKAYGLNFQVKVNAKAGKFAINELFVSLGASIANLAICKIICDFLVLWVMPKKKSYQALKIQRAEEDEAERYEDNDGGISEAETERIPLS